ncbi:hypothetical protein ACLOJK_016017 [Asimina triloba]
MLCLVAGLGDLSVRKGHFCGFYMASEEIRSQCVERKRGRDQLEGRPDRWDLVGRRVRKEFPGNGVFFGRIVRFKRGGLYLVEYEDGDREDLEYAEVCEVLVDGDGAGGAGASAGDSTARKQLSSRSVVKGKGGNVPGGADGADRCEDSSAVSKLSSADVESDADSSSDSSASELAQLSPLPLPPSSGDIGVPEESISYLFSVYNFLRSFSYRLFLSPFTLDEFVGSLNCLSQNSLLDAVHVSLMRALKRDFEMDCHDGGIFELTSKSLRYFLNLSALLSGVCVTDSLFFPQALGLELAGYTDLAGFCGRVSSDNGV